MEYKLPIVTFIAGFGLAALVFSTSSSDNSDFKQVETHTDAQNTVSEVETAFSNEVESAIEPVSINPEVLTQAPATIRLQVEELMDSVESLRAENNNLRQQVETTQQRYKREKRQRAELQRQLGAMDESEITDEQMKGLLNEPYDSFMTNFRGETRDRVYDFFQQPEDLDQGFHLQTQIGDFIQSHALSSGVQLDGVTCKGATCEIRVFEKDSSSNSWHFIWKELVLQPFWQFNSTHSSSRGNGEEPLGHWIFIFADSFNV